MKHFMMRRNAILRDIGESQSPNPSLTKSKSHRKLRSAKENAPPPDLNSLMPDHRFSPAKLKSSLPPPSSNPLKRKLIADAAADNGVAGVSDSGVKVIVRIKPPSKGEEEEMIVKKISNDALTINEQTFTFDSIADPKSTQDEIFQLVGAPLVENCLAGFNSSVFAYGQTGSGKTYTMWGPANGLLEEHLSGDQRGLTPRVFELLFARISEEQAKHAERQLHYQCRCSFLEIYNEQITDLLDPSQKNLMIREDIKSGVYVENLTEEYVKNLKDLSKLLVKGLANKRTCATSVNAESSRSHCVFTCVVESLCKSVADGLSSFKTSRINLVDLAGSERQKLTGAAGDRLKEAGNINRSLSQLGNLINILAEISQTGKQRHIPYTDSRLTFLLRESLGGNAKLAIVCSVSPSQSCRSETFSTLRFAQRAKAIQNMAVVNEVMQDDVNFLREVIRQLRDELQRVKDNNNHPTNPNASYTTSWNAHRSLSLLRSFGLSHPKSLPNGDDDGDTEMEIDEEAVERLCAQMGLPPAEDDMSRVEKINSSLQTVALKDESYNSSHLKSSVVKSTGKQFPEDTDVNMEDACFQTENNGSETDNVLTVAETMQTMDNGSSAQPASVTDSLHSCISDTNQGNSPSKAENIPSCQDLVLEADVSAIVSVADTSDDTEQVSVNPASPCLSIDPISVSPVLIPPTESASPKIRNSRKSLRTTSMSTASQKDIEIANQSTTEVVEPSPAMSTEMLNLYSAFSTKKSEAFPVPTRQLAAGLHKGMKLLDSYRQSTAHRRSTFRLSYKALECKPSTVLNKTDVGKERSDRDNEGLLKRDRRERDLTDGRETGNLPMEIERKDRHRTRRDVKERRHSDRYDDSQRDHAWKEHSRKREEKSEVAKPKLPELNPSDNNAIALGKTGGVYIPPFKLARMMKDVKDTSSLEYQRLTWDALRKSINGLVNKVNASNIKNIIPELFAENLIRGRGLFCRSCIKSQMASPGFTDVFAALVAVINSKFPQVAQLLLKRVVLQLKRAYKRNDKPQLLAAVKFIAHLVNQQVAEEIIALELVTVLLEDPTDDSVEVAVGFVTECGAMLQDVTPKGLHGIFERFRGILHEGEIDKRVQYLIEGLFAIRKAKFQGHPAVRPELDLVEEKYSHDVSLDQEIDPETALDVFKPDPDFIEKEKKYDALKKELLGEESGDEDGSDASSEDNDEEEGDESDEEDEEQMRIRDETETNRVNLRRTIYLTIMSSVDFEEAGHKLLKIKLEPGQEMELCIMILECCSQERTYLRYYGLLGQRFCMINKIHQANFEKCFVQQYSMSHRLETNKLRNVATFFAHLLGTDALPWHVLAYIRLTKEDTTSSSRIFIKIIFQNLSDHYLGIRKLNERLQDPTIQESLESIFPKDNPDATRFAINFFTEIGLGGITENLREYLKSMPRLIMQQQKQVVESESGSSCGSDSSGSESDSSSSSSSDESDREKRKRRRRS